ncbi:MAG: HEAT repeat domain-containing protein [Alphaproteobacteria bacterium]
MPNEAKANEAPRLTGLQRLQQDQRTTAELIATALPAANVLAHTEQTNDDLLASYDALAVLHARGTRDVLEGALALCAAPEPRQRILGAAILGELGSPERSYPEECCDALLNLVRHDRDPGVMMMAVSALGHLRNRRCEPELIALKNHTDEEIRHNVAFALCGTENPASVQALLELMEDPYDRARDWATTGIGQTVSIDGPEIRAALLRRANDSDEITRAEALHGLARRHDERVVPFLIVELQANSEREHLFQKAAQTFLGVDEESEIDSAELLIALRSGSPRKH